MFSCRHFNDFSFWRSSYKTERHVKKRSRGDFKWRLTSGKTKANVTSERETTQLGSAQLEEWGKPSSQNLRYLVNPENADERKRVETAPRKPVQITSKSEVGYSQVSRQENALIAQGNLCMEPLQKQSGQRVLSNSSCSGKCAGCDSKTRVSKQVIHEPSIHDQIFQFLQEKLGITAVYSTFLIEVFKNKCVDMANVHVLVNESSHPSWTQFVKIWRFTRTWTSLGNSERTQHRSEIDIGSFRTNSECETAWEFTYRMDEISIVSWSTGQVDKSKSACLLWLSSMCGDRWMKAKKQ